MIDLLLSLFFLSFSGKSVVFAVFVCVCVCVIFAESQCGLKRVMLCVLSLLLLSIYKPVTEGNNRKWET